MEQKEKRFTVRFPLDVLESIRALAQEEDRSINGEIVQAVRDYLKRKCKDSQKKVPVNG